MRPIPVIAVLAALAPHAAARQPAPPHPADATAPAPAAQHESAFAGYRAFRAEPIAPWREVNDEVARAGGHIGIMRGASGHGGAGAGKPAAAPARQ